MRAARKRKKPAARKTRGARIAISLSADEVADLDDWADARQLKRAAAVRILVTRGCRPSRV